eukprot:TRINITY_DN56805_c0_g1_i1.p1 TRINITY_DN56805_c0_g1~~TRINITY_DN56805_c0_g1_i1.p1  ORF type:complete len:108 (-),score=33.57 TRINITY_DN56805_c0_g1_i1:192-515(-)
MTEEEVSKKFEKLEVTEGSAVKTWDPMAFPEDRIAFLKKCFDEHKEATDKDGKRVLDVKLTHQLLFTAVERNEYGLKDFEGDIKGSMPDSGEVLSWTDVEKFMQENL